MTKRSVVCWLVLSCAVALALSPTVSAEEIEKKLRVSVSLGQFNTRETIPSGAGNILTIVGSEQQFVGYIEDPRNDNAALGQLSIRPAFRGFATLQYGVNRFFAVEGSVGYQRGDVGSIEMQAEFLGTYIEPIERHKYTIYNYKGGTMTQIPVRLTAIARFRPKAKLSPYLGFGAGYTVVGFTPSSDLNTLSQRLDGLVGGQTTLIQYPVTAPDPPEADAFEAMTGASVRADNYWEWHGVAGAEYSLKRKWSLYVDLRYETASRQFFLGFNGSSSVGIPLPNRQALRGSAVERAQYGPMLVENGGLVDGGVRVNPDIYTMPDGSVIQPPPGLCTLADYPACLFIRNFEMDAYNARYGLTGERALTPNCDGLGFDPAYYYVQGGSIRYGGTSLQFGVRYTF